MQNSMCAAGRRASLGRSIGPELRLPDPANAMAFSQPRSFLLLLENCKLLPQGEDLGIRVRLAMEPCPDKNEDHLHPIHGPLPNRLPFF